MIDGKSILEAAVDASRSRFRPILMMSFAFILSRAAGYCDLCGRQCEAIAWH